MFAGSAEQPGAQGSGCAVRMHGGGQDGVSDPSTVIKRLMSFSGIFIERIYILWFVLSAETSLVCEVWGFFPFLF